MEMPVTTTDCGIRRFFPIYADKDHYCVVGI